MIKCKNCGKETNKKVFCSRECMYAYKRKPKNKCLNCGKEVSRCEVKFCSIKCYAEYRHKKTYESKPKFKCIICGKETLNPKYCSMKCLGKDKNRISTAIKNLPNKRYLSKKEIKIIEKEYGKIPVDELAKKVKLSKQNLIATAYRKNIKSSRKWKDSEIKFLLENLNKDIRWLSKKLKRKKGSIISKVARINLGNRGVQKFMSDYLKELGCIFEEEVRINGFVTDILINGIDIEIQGSYWHGDPEVYDKDELNEQQINKIEKDKLKKDFFERCGIKVEYMWEWDIVKNPEKAKEKIRKIIGWPY